MVVLTSLNEGTPVSLIEAMASARPVVSTAVGGVKDLVIDGENGFLAKTGDAEDISDKILVLLNDAEKRRRFGATGRELVRKKYSKERLVDDIERLYERVLKEKGER